MGETRNVFIYLQLHGSPDFTLVQSEIEDLRTSTPVTSKVRKIEQDLLRAVNPPPPLPPQPPATAQQHQAQPLRPPIIREVSHENASIASAGLVTNDSKRRRVQMEEAFSPNEGSLICPSKLDFLLIQASLYLLACDLPFFAFRRIQLILLLLLLLTFSFLKASAYANLNFKKPYTFLVLLDTFQNILQFFDNSKIFLSFWSNFQTFSNKKFKK